MVEEEFKGKEVSGESKFDIPNKMQIIQEK